ncbi:CarD family transcriptional regulator [Pseudoneobacillus sp. C159]
MEVDDLFQIGDNVVYPMHGAGVIEAIEEKEIQGQTHRYFVIKMPSSNMHVMIRMDSVLKSGIRSIADLQTLKAVLLTFHQEEMDRSLTWKQRYQLNQEKMRSGKIEDSAEVIRDLSQIHKEKKLNSSEKQMLDNAKKIFLSEVGLINRMSEYQAKDLIDDTIERYIS